MTDDSRFVFGVDLDGVCFDYYGSIRSYAANWMNRPEEDLSPNFTYGFSEWRIDDFGGYASFHQYLLDHEYFERIPPLPNVAEVLQRLSDEKVLIRIITHRLFITGAHKQAIQQTVAWLDNFSIPYWDLCFVKDKPVVGADLYIEDTEKNIVALRASGHPTIAFGNVTNQEFPGVRVEDWREVERIVRSEHERWQTNHEVEAALLALPRP